MMTTAQELLNELTLEAEVTRKFLACVPFDQLSYQPTDKSEPLGRLAVHVAEIVAWWYECIDHDQLDFEGFEPKVFNTNIELLAYFDGLLYAAKAALSRATEQELTRDWSMTHGHEVLFTLPKKQVLRLFCMNHLVHHRAQLGMYLRLLGVPVPATYGPSADDYDVVLIRRFANKY